MAVLGKLAILTEDELTVLIRVAVQQAVTEALQEVHRQEVSRDQLVTRGQLAKHLGVTVGHISNLVKLGLPSIGLTRERRFRIADCEQWLSAHGVSTARNGQAT